ncbi:adenosylcobinamide-GDP ribazoletransferase [Streptomyces albidus (ex Kaewkla and Franco 2022)]|uniref:adenosylcobinamide-GDP ribazoletransferase n=1 Tax=Streptomyces albidus (ex Kaewkla and Franco 2022) TaxID=722709 RepID=UPI0015EF0486|nr:adenosylcobinamide-GDP ribazoletransferase [Streptomyces albidus (ex Kaewkla and Franco 2022)]
MDASPPDGPEASSGPDSTGSSDSSDRPATVQDGLRFALGTLTVIPVRTARWDREAARRGMEWAPLIGLLVGLTASALGAVALLLGTSALLAAILTVAVPALFTRALHLDGLADVADGLGSAKPPEDALRIMKQSDIGPFGVLTLVFVLLAQIAVVNELYEQGGWAHGALAFTVSAVTARTALTLAARSGVPAAREDGLGAVVAGTVPVRTAGVVVAVVTVTAAAAGAAVYLWDAVFGAVTCALAVLLGLAAAELLLRHCRRRLGGVTGDVFGALAETGATAALVVLALG